MPTLQDTTPPPQESSILRVLREVWGYDSFRPLQREAAMAVLAGRDSLVVLPTGGGKSICFQAPALLLDGTAVVVSPLISLMRDQVDQLRQNGVTAGCIHSGQPSDERRAVLTALDAGRLKLLYLSPERLALEEFGGILHRARVSFVAIDEAHCISAWGHDFRPEYRQLSRLRETLPGVVFHGYTATATAEVALDIVKQLGLREPVLLRGSFDRPNLHYAARPRKGGYDEVLGTIQRHPGESGIVYCISRKQVEATAGSLALDGIRALPYHAGLDARTRHENQDAFVADRAEVIVATIAFGMGINKPDVRFVVHLGMPKSIENYQQESGRAGRDGLPAECLLLHSVQDLITWRRIGEDAPPEVRRAASRQLDAIHAWCTGVVCRRRGLLAHFGETYPRKNCGSCDVCTGGMPLLPDSVTIAQKILSCVKRMGESENSTMVTRALLGSKDQRLIEAGHDKLSTYGLLKEHDRTAVGDWITQLLAHGLLAEGDHHALRVTEAGWEVLRNRASVMLLDRTTASDSAKAAPARRDALTDEEDGIFQRLRKLRKELAEAKNIPPFMIFGDVTLRDMARKRPRDLIEMVEVKGVGRQKLKDYGEEFLNALWEGQVPPPAGAPKAATKVSVNAAIRQRCWELFREEVPLEEIAARTERALSTVSGYLEEWIEKNGIADPSPWVSAKDARKIEAALSLCGEDRLKPIFEALEGKLTYGQIRVVIACRKNR